MKEFLKDRWKDAKDYFARNQWGALLGEKDSLERWFSQFVIFLLFLSVLIYLYYVQDIQQICSFLLYLLILFITLRLVTMFNSMFFYGKYIALDHRIDETNRPIKDRAKLINKEITKLDKYSNNGMKLGHFLNYLERILMTTSSFIICFSFSFFLIEVLNKVSPMGIDSIALKVDWDKWLGLNGFGFLIFTLLISNAKERVSMRLQLLENKLVELEKSKDENQINYLKSLVEKIWGRVDDKL
jgi:hypothetical protein